MREVLLVNIVGEDRPGLTHALSTLLAQHEVRVLDIGQAVIHDHLSLGMLLSFPKSIESYEVLKQVIYKAHELGLSIRLTPIEEEAYGEWVERQAQERTVFTLLGREITAESLSFLTKVLSDQGLNIEKISRLSHRVPLDAPAGRACIEFSVLGTPRDRQALHASIMEISQEAGVDISVQADDMFRRNRRLVVFDMDSTLIQCEVIDELAKLAGVGEKVSAITERAMQGELDFKGSFRERLALLKGLPWSEVERFADNLPLTEGAARLIGTLRRLGYKTAICSGGFDVFGKRLQETLGIDYVFANHLEAVGGKLTGSVVGDIVDGERKASHVRDLAAELSLSLSQVIAVGDGANDLPMIRQAGLGIAFRAKPLVRQSAKNSISILGLDGILYLIGVRDRDLLASERQ